MTVNGNRLELPSDCHFANYAAVKKSLITAGGKYNRCGFIFNEDAQAIKDRLVGGEAIDDKKKFQFFPTPRILAEKLVELAELNESHTVLEPSAGQGAIANLIKRDKYGSRACTVIELMDQNIKALQRQGYFVHEGDFLSYNPEGLGKFDRIVANPPFTKNQDIDHIRHMYRFLKEGGRLVSMASKSWVTGSQKKQKEFRQWLASVSTEIIDVDAGEFKESGTMVSSSIVIIEKKG